MRLGWWNKVAHLATAMALLSACADNPQIAAKQKNHKHVSPAAVPAPILPAGSFDLTKEKSELERAHAALANGDAAQARVLAEAAIDHWPGDGDGWDILLAASQAQNDDQTRRYATFFRSKIDYVNPLPPRVAVLGFQNIAEEKPGVTEGGYTFDAKTIAMARRMQAFYNTLDPINAQRDAPTDESFTDKYPYLLPGVAAIVGGIVAVTLSKSTSGN